ncbi:IclR family transcriptional regulator domain-containing protein [Litorilituus lipolyticus]|uniref:IclR family transcriptional regulator n=1 Tax=Litorilituus lipolyticus TaxID=2491017 RepID=A0A502KSA6_9GAMM|nr:IclR family transcriptional regulator C-terminal domain-containing protein [Litorilituus lipolyticus]TPH12503.1 IclR family transcriptional regulator [Litorilituus lipolyticus]
MSEDIKPTELVQSLVKGLVVIQAFNQQRPAMTLSEVASVTGYTRAATRRFLLTLVNEGFAKQEGKLFSLTAKVLNLGFAYLSTVDVWHNAKPIMEQLVEQLNESCSAAVLDGNDVVYVARVATTKRIMSITLNVGTRLPAISTSMGRMLLASLSDSALDEYLNQCDLVKHTQYTLVDKVALKADILQVRTQGYSIVEQEFELGLTSISVPVHNGAGEVIAALNVSTHMSQTARQQILEVILPALKHSVKRIEQLG